MNQDIINQLRAPFPFDEVEAKIQVTSNDKTKGMAVFYVDSRAIQKRLDEVVGPMNWKNQYYPWQNQAQLCGIGIYNVERDEWVEKQDGAPNTDIEAVMGGLSHSFKRAACAWSIGRYLYQMDGIWVEVEQRGKGSYIKDNQQSKLKSEYEKAVNRIFGTAAPISSFATKPQTQVTSPPKTETQSQPVIPPESNNMPADTGDYTVRSAKTSGKNSLVLELLDANGEVKTAYIKANDEAIRAGVRLQNVEIEQKSSSYGQYNLVSNYQLVA